MGEDHDVVQEELQSEPSIDFDGEEESEEVESEYEDDSVFVMEPHDAAVTGTTWGPRASSNTPEARKSAADGDTAQEELKRARVEQHSEAASTADPPSGQKEAIVGFLMVGSGHGIPQDGWESEESVPSSADMLRLGSRPPPGIWSFRLPPLSRALR
jgi:hypothetical protein